MDPMAKLLAIFLVLLGLRSFILGVYGSMALLTKEGRQMLRETEETSPFLRFALEIGSGAIAWMTLFFFSAIPIWIGWWLWSLE